MRPILLTLLLCLPCSAARIESGDFTFPDSCCVNRIRWVLATDGGNFVNFVTYALGNGTDFVVVNAIDNNDLLTFDSWQAALNDPLYTQSIIEWNGIPQGGPLLRERDINFANLLFSRVDNGDGTETVHVWALEAPEPAAVLLLLEIWACWWLKRHARPALLTRT